MEMQTNNDECFVCGSNNFTLMDGAFICDECGIQSQTIREEQISFIENIVTVTKDDADDVEITAGTRIKNTKKLLSWECFNLILLGLTDEIIELGAKPNIKVIVLQLWVRYLQLTNAAFISKQSKKLPKFKTAINNIDGSILYGVENIKNKLFQAKTGIKFHQPEKPRIRKRKPRMSSESSASYVANSVKKGNMTKKLRRMDKSTRGTVNESVNEISEDVSLLQRSQKPRSIKIKLDRKIKNSLKSINLKTDNLSSEETSNLLHDGRKYWQTLKISEKKTVLSVKRVVSIIQLALMINNDDIFMSDIMRWINEGHLHVHRIDMFLPENVVHGLSFEKLVNLASRKAFTIELNNTSDILKIYQLPNIDLQKLVIRFCDELQLPSDFTHFVCKLVLISPDSKNHLMINDIEIKAMSYILFAAKFILTLDGHAENLSSDFAGKVNLSNKIDKKLFNWNEYVKYIECRNSVISEYNYMTYRNLYGNHMRKTELFINNWNLSKSTVPLQNYVLNKGFKETTECLLKSLPPKEKKERCFREIPPSTKPISSTLKWIFEYYSAQLSEDTKIILQQNFIQTDISYLTDKNRIQDLAGECNIPIEVNCNMPFHYSKYDPPHKPTILKIANRKVINVHIIDEPLNEQINKDKQGETFHTYLNEETPNMIYLGGGFNYWCLHIKELERTDINQSHTILKQQLPYSFFWFMQQCSKILDCQLCDLNLELMYLENIFMTFLKQNDTSNWTKECVDMLSNITL